MPEQLVVSYDPSGQLLPLSCEVLEATGAKQAILSLPDRLEDKDVYALAKRLAELLLEQFN